MKINKNLQSKFQPIVHQQDLAWNENLKNFVDLRFANLLDYCIPATIISYLMFFGIGGYLHVSTCILYIAAQNLWNCLPIHVKFCPFFAHWNKPSFLLWYVLPPMWRQSQDIAHLFHWFALISKMDFLKKYWGRRGQRTIEVHSLLYPKTKGSWYIKIIV